MGAVRCERLLLAHFCDSFSKCDISEVISESSRDVFAASNQRNSSDAGQWVRKQPSNMVTFSFLRSAGFFVTQ